MNRLDDYLFTPEYISRGGPHDGGEITARFIDALKRELPEAEATVHSTASGRAFYAFCSSCSYRGRTYNERDDAVVTAIKHNRECHL